MKGHPLVRLTVTISNLISVHSEAVTILSLLDPEGPLCRIITAEVTNKSLFYCRQTTADEANGRPYQGAPLFWPPRSETMIQSNKFFLGLVLLVILDWDESVMFSDDLPSFGEWPVILCSPTIFPHHHYLLMGKSASLLHSHFPGIHLGFPEPSTSTTR